MKHLQTTIRKINLVERTNMSKCWFFFLLILDFHHSQHLQAEAETSSFRCQHRTSVEDCFFSTWKPLNGVRCTKHSACDSVKLLNVSGENPILKNADLHGGVLSTEFPWRLSTIFSIPGWSRHFSIFCIESRLTFTASRDSSRPE